MCFTGSSYPLDCHAGYDGRWTKHEFWNIKGVSRKGFRGFQEQGTCYPTLTLYFGWLNYNKELHVLVLSPALCPLSQCPLHHLSCSIVFTKFLFSLFIRISDICNVHFQTCEWWCVVARTWQYKPGLSWSQASKASTWIGILPIPISSFSTIHLTYNGYCTV